MTAFVTGGTGFVGSHVVEELARRGFGEIRCLVRSRLRWLEDKDVVAVEGDLFQETALRTALEGVDHVFHIGGVTRARQWHVFGRENVDATLRLLQAVADYAPAVRSVVVTSSLAAIGRCDRIVPDEDAPLRPVSLYGRSKAQMELAVAERSFGLPITIVRPPSVYGPREADIYTLFKSANRGLFPVIGNGREPDVSLVHVRDLARGMVDAALSERTRGNTYFLGSIDPYSWRDVHRAMSNALGRRSIAIQVPPSLIGAIGALSEAAGSIVGTYPPLNREKAREARWACKMCSSARAQADFGYNPTIPLDEGFRETVQWYRAAGWL